jgi:hypothetical protein
MLSNWHRLRRGVGKSNVFERSFTSPATQGTKRAGRLKEVSHPLFRPLLESRVYWGFKTPVFDPWDFSTPHTDGRQNPLTEILVSLNNSACELA